jgi:hypothetical protein
MQTVYDDVRREVARCIAERAILRVAPAAERIAADHSNSGFSPNVIASMLLKAGVSAAVPMEIDMPGRRRDGDAPGDRIRRL